MFVSANNRIMCSHRLHGLWRMSAGYSTSTSVIQRSLNRTVVSNTLSDKKQVVKHPSGTRTMSTSKDKLLTMDNINEHIIKMEYAVRGPLVIRAGEIEKELSEVIFFIERIYTFKVNCVI